VNRSRRSLLFLGIGCALALLLAVILFAGVGTASKSNGSSSPPGGVTNLTNVAPGIGAADANLLQLNVAPPASAPSAPDFTLTDQHGQPVTLSRLRGKVVIWSLNDDQCTDLCTLLAESVIAADKDLGTAAADVVFLSVNANPYYPAPSDVLKWSQTNLVEDLSNWVYVTGTPAQLQKTWSEYKVSVQADPATRTVAHDAFVEFIDPAGKARAYGYFGEGAISTAYYAHALAQMADDLLPASEQVKVGGPAVDSPATSRATISSPAPSFSLTPLTSGAPSSLPALDTKPLVLNFWSSTCAACTQEMPALEKVQRDLGQQVNVVGIDVADPRSSAAEFARRLGVTYPLLADPDGSTAAAFQVPGLPVTFVIAPGGTILARNEGSLTAPQLEAVLQMDFQQLNG
jgi:cytochrome oxidase Cu insertion factor (SCO1/SenC/PrrC family)